MAKKVALGKGIASLIQENPSEVVRQTKEKLNQQEVESKNNETSEHPTMVSVEEIYPNPNQPRKIFKQKELEELAASIKANGVIQPLIVIKREGEKGYELIAGERRLRASKMAGLERLPVVIKRATERDRMIMSIIENVQRSDLNCVEEALAYYHLMEEYQLNQEELAKRLGKERSTIANFLRILKLPREVVELIQKDYLNFGHAKVLAAVKEREDLVRLANKTATEELSVRELEKLIKSTKNKPSGNKPKDTQQHQENEKVDRFRQKIEQKTGFHCNIKTKKNGQGDIILKFSNEAEFNDIYEYLLSR